MKPTLRAVTTIGSSDLIVSENHLLVLPVASGILANVGSSSRRGKTLILNPCCLADASFAEKTLGDHIKEKSGVKPLKAV